MGKLALSVGEIQGYLRQIAETRKDLTPDERMALICGIEAVELMKKLAPGIKKALEEKRA